MPLPSLLFGHSQRQQQEQEDSSALYSVDGFQGDPQAGGDLYRTLLQQAEEVTFNVGTWAAGSEEQEQRMLQEAEGMLQVCIQVWQGGGAKCSCYTDTRMPQADANCRCTAQPCVR